MDPLLLLAMLFMGAIGVAVVGFIIKLKLDERRDKERTRQLLAGAAPARPNRPVVVAGGRRGAARRRPRRLEADLSDEEGGGGAGLADSDGEEGAPDASELGVEGKVGKKKLAKLQAKEEKRAAREADAREREERKEREAADDVRRAKEAEKEAEAERLEEERLKKEREEKERREQEAYEAMKADFAVEEEGYDEDATLDSPNLLIDFIDYIKNMKVVNMDELAGKFKLKTAEVVERVKQMVDEGTLTGVIDDRGKFIYITEGELEAVAKFINQRGRITIGDLADHSNRLIRLAPLPSECADAS